MCGYTMITILIFCLLISVAAICNMGFMEQKEYLKVCNEQKNDYAKCYDMFKESKKKY